MGGGENSVYLLCHLRCPPLIKHSLNFKKQNKFLTSLTTTKLPLTLMVHIHLFSLLWLHHSSLLQDFAEFCSNLENFPFLVSYGKER